MKPVVSALIPIALSVCLMVLPTLANAVSDARVITTASDDCPGGICIVLGDEIGELALALSQEGRFVVQALVPDKAALGKARSAIRSSGKYGPVSVDCSTYDYLPYAENLINLVVVDDYPNDAAKGLSIDEVFRVLAPLGSVYLGFAEQAA